ncbi:MAG: GtrA family protein [Acidimicrobiales bacterium]
MTTAVARHLPFGLSRIVAPTLVGYALINSCTFGVDIGVLTVLHGVLGWPLPLAVTISYSLAFALSFVLNRTFNFAARSQLGRQTAIYVAVVALNYLVNILGVVDGLAALGVEYQLARLLGSLCEAAFMYSALRWLVFREKAPAAQAAVASEVGLEGPTPVGRRTGDPACGPGA